MTPIEAAIFGVAAVIFAGVITLWLEMRSISNPNMNSQHDYGKNSAGYTEQYIETDTSTEITGSYDGKKKNLSGSAKIVRRNKSTQKKINLSPDDFKQPIDQLYANKLCMDKSRQTFDHETGQVHKDNKGVLGAIDFKPAL